MTDYKMFLPFSDEVDMRDLRQQTVLEWCKRNFSLDNEETNADTRCLRFIEEALELAQAHGLSKELVQKQLDITFDRPVGAVVQEVGGVMVTLQAFCAASSISLADAELNELHRCNSKPEGHFQKRQREKREQGL